MAAAQELELIILQHQYTLEDLPEPTNCGFCNAPEQREFTDYKEWVTATCRLGIFAEPCYGCTECGLKSVDPRISIDLLGKASDIVLDRGDLIASQRFMANIELLKSALPNLG